MNREPMTVHGAAMLRKELEHLKQVERPRLSDAIAEARAHGDLKENAEYHAAREQQGLAEARIRQLEAKLSNAQVIDVKQIPNKGRVIFGATVDLMNVETDEEIRYQIVCEDEADIKAQKISVTSPIARGLVGREEGESVEIKTPAGLVEYEIVEVHYI